MTAAPSRPLWVLFVSGLLGFRVGIVGFPDWQVAVETSQVLAGLVKYPAGNPFFIYHLKLWTVLHQICAPLLLAGVSEIRLSLILSGVLGMVTFQALAIFVYAFSGEVWLAIGAAVLIFVTRAAEYGAVYGLFLMGTENTYGILGLSFCVLAISLIGAGCYRTGALLLGAAPAVHPSLGVWTGAIAGCAFLTDFTRLREELRPALRWFLSGCGITLLSLAAQLAFIASAPRAAASRTFSTQEMAAFINMWDGHRRPVALQNNGVLLNAGALVMAAIWLAAFASDLPRSAVFLLRFVLVGACVSLMLVFVSWIPPDKLPTMLLVFMPGRVLNFDAFTYTALVIGLAGNYRRLWSQLLLLVLFVGLSVGDHSMLWEWLQRTRGIDIDSHVRPLWVVTAVSAALIIGAAFSKGRARVSPNGATQIARLATAGILFGAMVCTLGFSKPRSLIYRDRTNDVFFGQVAAGQGVLLTAGDLHLIQLKTRRPVLLDGGGLDGVMYSLEAGPEMERILREVYGVDLFNPPEEGRGSGRIPPQANQKAWESYSTEQWRAIGRRDHVTQVLTYPDWTLNLPLAAQSRRMLLYQIPQ